MAVVLVTHDREVAARAHREIRMRDGVIVRVRLAEAWRVALDALRANRLRSGLTMLGVVIGVAAVVVLVALGTGTKQKVEQQVEGLGSNLLIVVPGRIDFNAAPAVSRMTLADVDAVTRIVGDPSGWRSRSTSGETVRAGTRSRFTSVLGVLETTPQVFVRDDRARLVPHPLRRGHLPAGGRARRRRSPTPCSATATRSGSRSRSPGYGSG